MRRAKSRLTADEHKELFAERLRQRFAVERIEQGVDAALKVVDEPSLLRLKIGVLVVLSWPRILPHLLMTYRRDLSELLELP